jgi:16S rRNA processing protein RimM
VDEAALLEIGRITRAHGLRGEVVVAPITNRAERFRAGSQLHAGDRVFVVEKARPLGNQWVVHFAGVGDRNAAEALRSTALFAPPLGPLGDDEMWVHELVGCQCVDVDDAALGIVTAVQANPAHDLLVVDDRVLIPMVFVVRHDVAARRVVVDPPEGLIELYR